MHIAPVKNISEGTSPNFLGTERNLVQNLHGGIDYEKCTG